MFTAADRVKYQSAWEGVVDLLGVPAIWQQAKPPQATKNVTVGFKSASWKDTELVAAYGLGAKVITVKVKDIAVVEKFDQFVIGSERYTADSVMPVHFNGILIFWKAYIKGK
jgi:hypothetical protein